MDIYEKISAAGREEIAAILDHVLFCYKQLYPQWEVSVVSIDKREDRNEQLNSIIAMLENMKEK